MKDTIIKSRNIATLFFGIKYKKLKRFYSLYSKGCCFALWWLGLNLISGVWFVFLSKG